MFFWSFWSFSNYSNFLLSLVLISSSSIIYFLCFYYWIMKNPYFIIFNYGSTICSLIICVDTIGVGIFYFAVYQIMILPLIIYFIYLIVKIKVFSQGMDLWAKKKFTVKYGAIQAYGKKRLDQFWHDDVDILSSNNSGDTNEELITLQREKEIEKQKMKEKKHKYKLYLIILLTLILTMTFLSAYFYELIFL